LPLIERQAGGLQGAVSAMEQDGKVLSGWIQALPAFAFSDERSFTAAQALFSEILADDNMASHKCLRLLIVHWAACQIRVWTQKLK